MKFKRVLFGLGLTLMLSMQTLHAQQSDLDTKELAELRAKAEKGDADAQYRLSGCYIAGKGVMKSYAEAMVWLRKAAEQNHAKAQLYLARGYTKGVGVPKDEVEAMKWLRKAADLNLAMAQTDLGVRYFKGVGLPKDATEGVRWIRKAAEQNDPEAQSSLGWCYYIGEGVPKDMVEAYRWSILAVRSGMGIQQIFQQMAMIRAAMSSDQIAEAEQRVNFLGARSITTTAAQAPKSPNRIKMLFDFKADVHIQIPSGTTTSLSDGPIDLTTSNFNPPVHPLGSIEWLTINGKKVTLLSTVLKNGILSTTDYGDIEVLLTGVQRGQCILEYWVHPAQIEKIKKDFPPVPIR